MHTHMPFLRFTFTTSYKRPHPTLSPQAIFPDQVILIAAPRRGCPNPLTRIRGEISPLLRNCVHHPSAGSSCLGIGHHCCHLAEQKVQRAHCEEIKSLLDSLYHGSYHGGRCTISSLQLDYDDLTSAQPEVVAQKH